MRHSTASITAVTLLGILAWSLSAAANENVKKALDVLYRRSSKAYAKKDIEAFLADKTADFVLKTLDGHLVTSDDLRQTLPARWQRMKEIKYLKIKIRDLQIAEAQAVAVTEQEFARVVAGPDGKTHTVVTKGTLHRDTWVRTEQGWKIRIVQEIEQGSEIVDGVPLKPKRN